MNALFGEREGVLTVGGVEINRLADRAGRTPFFAYDRATLDEHVCTLRDTLPAGIDLHYSIKANPMPAVVHHLAPQMDGFDVASANEMELALNAGMPAELIGFAGPGKSRDDLRRAVASGVNIHLESVTQLHLVTALGWELGVQPKVAIRVNPDFHVDHSGMRMGGGGTPFGLDAEQVPELLRELDAREVALTGFHIFWGSQCLHAPTVIKAQRKSADLAVRLAAGLSLAPQYVNFGGGFGIPYFAGETPLDLAAVTDAMHDWLGVFRGRLPDTRTVLEFGRYLVGEAGIYVCRVIDRKVSRNRTFLITDGGLHHHLAASGNFGQILRRNFPVAIGNRQTQAPTERCHIVGCLCTPLDRIADDVLLPEARIGDFVVVFQSGAYGRSASPRDFLGHPDAIEMLV
ncbi:TPA: pyridoxal-dependent decarboxylase, exosortase A system-associated [Burkholderia aenigmatica]|uniref:pyridoxal-dependent decarboxylase, exosortase A system-associated n=1 Tax=Burkholderia sp. AU45251 TaxID=3059204 RepID=UPI00264C9A96|nr:pyridoxal-dependent decarboxylase, exosortase A system-associated [Burkholderia sp. AU45251]HDR9483133.1 pyridoxal-dependent decarboxylase, exosortase A system-associated [Burkholderia aenigmatica]MDN7515997.1 pyridoxal-dependent decarboxylase, exosortase A system-associated [Burkholderia sp. AU45251]HDR9514081.1 pyridoxal-dependent decarboxylase, exosortase A system-associated [Burkholderia aenigmatica]HDR9591471.1 pyridoxal-dependent decarboxylase, exosortase A system-associated [Burkholde